VPISADLVATSAGDSLLLLCQTIEGAWAHRSSGLVVGVSGVPVANLNGVQVESLGASPGEAEVLLDRIAASGLPYSLKVRAGAASAFGALALQRGMVLEERVPLMALDDDRHLPAAQVVDGLAVRQLSPEEHGLHVAVAAAGFDAPAELFKPMCTPAALRTSGVRCYIGEVDGLAVTTGLAVTIGDLVAVFNVATPEAHRGNGYGAAVTARAVADGLANGASAAWLQSSAMGYQVYERLGFTTLEMWDCWVTPA
jgi:hypothetical protein